MNAETSQTFTTRCAICGQPSAIVKLVATGAGTRLIYSGPGGSSGDSGDLITPDRERETRSALSEPYSMEKFRAADFYDCAGYCGPCSKVYCSTHWNVTSSGGGFCPEGHFKSLDPHWSPDFE